MNNSRNNALFVGGLLASMTETTLNEYFSSFESSIKVKLIKNWVTGESKRCAIVLCPSKKIKNLILNANPHTVNGKILRVNEADQEKRGKKKVLTTKIFLAHLSPKITETHLSCYFKRYGKLRHVIIINNSKNERRSLSKNGIFGYLEFVNAADTKQLLQNRHNVEILGTKIYCQPFKAKTREEGRFIKLISGMNTTPLKDCLAEYFLLRKKKDRNKHKFEEFLQNLEHQRNHRHQLQPQNNCDTRPPSHYRPHPMDWSTEYERTEPHPQVHRDSLNYTTESFSSNQGYNDINLDRNDPYISHWNKSSTLSHKSLDFSHNWFDRPNDVSPNYPPYPFYQSQKDRNISNSRPPYFNQTNSGNSGWRSETNFDHPYNYYDQDRNHNRSFSHSQNQNHNYSQNHSYNPGENGNYYKPQHSRYNGNQTEFNNSLHNLPQFQQNPYREQHRYPIPQDIPTQWENNQKSTESQYQRYQMERDPQAIKTYWQPTKNSNIELKKPSSYPFRKESTRDSLSDDNSNSILEKTNSVDKNLQFRRVQRTPSEEELYEEQLLKEVFNHKP